MESTEDIFLFYANTSLKENPEIFYKIIANFNALEFIKVDYKLTPIEFGEKSEVGLMDGIIKHFVELVKCENLQTVINKLRKKAESIENDKKESFEIPVAEAAYRYSTGFDFAGISAGFFQIAFQAIFGYDNGFFEDKNGCIHNFRKDFLGAERFMDPDRIKCYECDQLFFRYMLKGITNGKEYSNIGYRSLESLLAGAHRNFSSQVLPVDAPSKFHFKENLKPFISYLPELENGEEYKEAFRSIFIDDIIAYSLCEFLLNNDRRKLKLCEQCDIFFVASKVDARIKYCSSCSSKSKMSKEERREYQRKYRQKKKQEKLTIQREARIENLMKRGGCSREEAVEYIEADSMM